jgi:hypothetical protein
MSVELGVAIASVISAAIGGFFAWMQSRNNTDTKVKLAKIEAEREREKQARESEKITETALLKIIEHLGTSTESLKDLHKQCQRDSETIADAKQAAQNNGRLLHDFRTESQQAHGSQVELIGGLHEVLREIPREVDKLAAPRHKEVIDKLEQAILNLASVRTLLKLDADKNPKAGENLNPGSA